MNRKENPANLTGITHYYEKFLLTEEFLIPFCVYICKKYPVSF